MHRLSSRLVSKLSTPRRPLHRCCSIAAWLFALASLAAPSTIAHAETIRLNLDSPRPHQVVQRTGIARGSGYAMVSVSGAAPTEQPTGVWEYRVVSLGVDPSTATTWTKCRIEVREGRFQGLVRVAAGGWYRLELRYFVSPDSVAQGAVDPLGVGEVFVVAGQSYATNTNDEKLVVTDARKRVAAFHLADGTWQLADDPQPAPDGSNGGSIWPPLGDALASELDVPIGFANVAVGGTSSTQWLPEGNLHPRLAQVGRTLGNFRGVLWQQGESDVIDKTTTEQYVANIVRIRGAAAAAWNFERPWLLAKSTHHPTVYNDPDGEERIRRGIDLLVARPGFRAGPDTDTLRGEHRGGPQSRRHFTGVGQRRAAEMWRDAIRRQFFAAIPAERALRVGFAEVDITPPQGFPMAGYYHERLADGQLDPLQAKAVVFQDDRTSAAVVVCDLIGIATDLSRAVRERAAAKTGIPAANIVLAATHSHTAPDYMKELYLYLGNDPQDARRKAYIEQLIARPIEAIALAKERAAPSLIEQGAAIQSTPVSFNRRFVMRDGSVRTWMNFENPEVVRAAGPIDPRIELLAIRDPAGVPRGVLSNFALHLDTVGGTKWSADYPNFVSQRVREALGPDVVSLFGTGCCGDINHANPRSRDRNKVDVIGTSLGDTIVRQISQLAPVDRPQLAVQSRTVRLPLQDASAEAVARSTQLLAAARRQEKIDFFDHVLAYKTVMLDHFRHREPHTKAIDHLTWGLSRSLQGIGDSLPVDVTVIALGHDVAIVCLPGEVFVDLGLAIKQGSPFATTLVIELSNHVETIYVPHRAAYAGGSYEVTNSAVEPGSGEVLVETALELLRAAATANRVP